MPRNKIVYALMNKALIARSCLENYSAAAAAAATAAQLQPALHIHFVSPLHRDERAAPRPAKAAPNLVPGSALLRAIVCPDHLPPAGLIAGHEERGGRPRKFALPPPPCTPLLSSPCLPVPISCSLLFSLPVSISVRLNLCLSSLSLLCTSNTLSWTLSRSLTKSKSLTVLLSGLELEAHGLFSARHPSCFSCRNPQGSCVLGENRGSDVGTYLFCRGHGGLRWPWL